MPHFGLRTEEDFVALTPRQNTPFHILPIEGRIRLCPIDEPGKEISPEQRTAASGIRMSTNAVIIFGQHIRYFEKPSSIANFGQAGFFTPAGGILKVDL